MCVGMPYYLFVFRRKEFWTVKKTYGFRAFIWRTLSAIFGRNRFLLSFEQAESNYMKEIYSVLYNVV